jgi:hypothetical protein
VFFSSLILITCHALLADDQVAEQSELTPAVAREAIDTTYKKWGRARVDLDKEVMNSILAPDFYVLLYGRRMSREEFLSQISQERPGARLTRFDTEVLTVRKSDDGWTAVISERLEVTLSGADGKTQKMCSLWITRDGWRKNGDRWVVTFSEAIGHENWPPGTTPPIRNW